MVRGAITRFVAAAGVLAATAAMAIGLAPAAAYAEGAPKPAPKPNIIQITGKGIDDKIVITQAESKRLFSSLLSEVNWMYSARSQTASLPADKLGPKYNLTVLSGKTGLQTYDVFPSAAGGPRAHRLAKQPGGKKAAEGWFYGRLTMPETLRVSGVPLKAKPDVVGGGIGGGVGQDLDVDTEAAGGVDQVLGDIRRLFLLNGAVLVVIFAGLAGIAFLIRRRV
ncbi:hypothetical protein Aab01nite_38200 [Paractinoplanes abujensis]|uniref:Uncharacterized protein n=1 Tax=Paractinoplanes abujensis TaxID=882441 RepID=A0A7W7G548_9ACTN|nr:hypothetical protein [Actinoplanes abujensis]MBB4694556.1 hypothetical protein [Actinoplanes abujensis]GID20230.1 hypothetical protein Aab01nite_38200 [Actinoplanes abujensis]